MAFNLSSCPPGWSAYAPALGRVLVGGGTVGVTRSGPLNTHGDPGGPLSDGGPNFLTQVPDHSHPIRIAPTDTNPHRFPIPPDGSRFTFSGTQAPSQYNSCGMFSTVLTDYFDPPGTSAVRTCETGGSGTGVYDPGVDVSMPYVQLLYCQKD